MASLLKGPELENLFDTFNVVMFRHKIDYQGKYLVYIVCSKEKTEKSDDKNFSKLLFQPRYSS
jgi:hypothetical protein